MTTRRIVVAVLSYGERIQGCRLLDHLVATGVDRTSLLVVVNPGPDSAERAIRTRHPDVCVIDLPANLGYAAGMNRALDAAARAGSDVVVLLTDDVLVDWSTIEALVADLDADPRLALVGPRLVERRDGSVHSVGGWIRNGVVGHDHDATARRRAVTWVDGAVLAARTRPLLARQGFDERFFLYGEDVDLCLRLRAAGWSVAVDADLVAECSGGFTDRRTAYHYLSNRNLLEAWRKQRAWRDLLGRLRLIARNLVVSWGGSRVEAWGAAAFLTRRFGPPPARLLRGSDVLVTPRESPPASGNAH